MGIVPRRLALPLVLAVLMSGTTPAWACHPPSDSARVHVSFLADNDLGSMVKWAKGTICVDYAFEASLSRRRLAQSVILTVPAHDVEAVFEVLLHSMNLHTTGSGPRRHIVADGPETDESRESHQREKADAERDRIFDHIETEIRRKDDSHFSISRRGADAILANLAMVSHSLQATPESKDDRPIGFRLVGMRNTSVLALLGFLNGDVVQSLNGRDISTSNQVFEAYTKLRWARHYQAHVIRDGKPLTIDLKID